MENMISVIIPVYNVEKYLDECLQSVLCQTYQNFEIILVDDGSSDRSSSICDTYAGIYKNIRATHQKNKGPGAARNSGLVQAQGQFVMFLDADDYIVSETLEIVLNKISEENADVCYFTCENLYISGQIVCEQTIFPDTLTGNEIMDEFFPRVLSISQRKKDDYNMESSSLALYRTEFLVSHAIFFRSEWNMPGEDILFNVEVCRYSQKITFVNQCLYVIRENPQSMTHSYRGEWLQEAEELYQIQYHLVESLHPSQDAFYRIKDKYISNIIVTVKQSLLNSSTNYKEKRAQIREISKSSFLPDCFHDYPFHELSIEKKILLLLLRAKFADLIIIAGYIKKTDNHMNKIKPVYNNSVKKLNN